MANGCADDRARVAQVLRGDTVAAAALVERLQPLVQTVVRRRLPRRTSEADLVQTVFLNVFTKLEQYSGRVPLDHWVSRIAVNTCLGELRRERSRPELRRADLSEEQDSILESLAASDDELSPHQQLAARELVEKVLERLSPREHLIVSMLYLEGRTLPEVRDATGWSVLAIKLLAFRARQKMKKALKQLVQESSQ